MKEHSILIHDVITHLLINVDNQYLTLFYQIINRGPREHG